MVVTLASVAQTVNATLFDNYGLPDTLAWKIGSTAFGSEIASRTIAISRTELYFYNGEPAYAWYDAKFSIGNVSLSPNN